MKSEIVLIRHGITEGNEKHMYYGATDVSLSARGRKELAKQAAEGLYPDCPGAQYFISGMTRTEQSLELMYGKKEYGVIEELKELNFGDFEMKRYDELESIPEYRSWVTAEDDSTPPPNGESIRDFSIRVAKGFEKLKTANELLMLKLRNRGEEAKTICVCHGGVICGIMAYLWPDEKQTFYEWIPDPGHGYILEVEDGNIRGYRVL